MIERIVVSVWCFRNEDISAPGITQQSEGSVSVVKLDDNWKEKDAKGKKKGRERLV